MDIWIPLIHSENKEITAMNDSTAQITFMLTKY